MLRKRARQARKRKRYTDSFRNFGPEKLEERRLLTVEPLSLADPNLYGDSPNGDSNLPSMSADGQLIVFQSTADDLVPNDFNGASDVFLYNRTTGDVSLISINAMGTASGTETRFGTAASYNPVISRDGRFVAFESGAADLVDGFAAVSNQTDIFVRDLQEQTTHLVSANRDNPLQDANNMSRNALLSGDGKTVVFLSNASDLVTGIDGTPNQLYAWNFDTKQTELVSVNRDGNAPGNSHSNFNHRRQFSVSQDGRFVAFRSLASDLTDIDNNGIDQIYLRDRDLQTTSMVSVDFLGGIGGNGHSEITSHAISDDGRYVTFYGGDRNVVDLPVDIPAVYVRDMQEGVTSLASVYDNGSRGGQGYLSVISDDGTRVAFHSNSDNLDPRDLKNFGHDVYVRDLTTNDTILVSENAQGTSSGANTLNVRPTIPPTITPDGRFVGFHSTADDLVNQLDTNQANDVFVRDLQTGTTRLASRSLRGTATADGSSYTNTDPIFHLGSGLSDDGRFVAFESAASNLVVDDNNRRTDLFVADVEAGLTQLASPLDSNFTSERIANSGGALQSISEDGRYVAYTATQGDVGFGSDIVLSEPLPFAQSAVFVYDRQTGTTVVGSQGEGDAESCLHGTNPVLSGDGRFLAFTSNCALDGRFPRLPGSQFNDVFVRDLLQNKTEQISVSADGNQVGNNQSGAGDATRLRFSSDGRYVAFLSFATNLVDGISYQGTRANIFLHDRNTGVTRLVNESAEGGTNSEAFSTSLLGFSKDNRRLLFSTHVLGENMIDGSQDTNNAMDVYVYDLEGSSAFETRIVSANPDGDAGNGHSGFDATGATISNDGRLVAFSSVAPDLVPNAERNANRQVYVRDIDAGTTQLVSWDQSNSTESNGHSYHALISGDGQRIVFESSSRDLTSIAGNGKNQLYVRDLALDTTELITVDVNGSAPADDHSGNLEGFAVPQGNPAWSQDGRYLAFNSFATDLVADYQPSAAFNFQGSADLYIHDFESKSNELITYTNTGTQSTGLAARGTPIRTPIIATNRGEVFFNSEASNLIEKDRNQTSDAFVYQYEGTASIAGNVFLDTNKDGTRDADDSGLPFWNIYIDENQDRRFNPGETKVQTDNEGNYRFTGLPPGYFQIRLDGQSGFGLTTSGSFDVDLRFGESVTIGSFGVERPNVDLLVQHVVASETGSPGALIDVTFNVVNTGASRSGSWQDAVYLSPTPTLSPESILMSTIPRDGGLTAGGSYRVQTTVVLPNVPEGRYFVIGESDRRFQVTDDTSRRNNSTNADIPIQVEIQPLVLNESFTSGFQSMGQDIYFKVEVESGETLQIQLDSSASSGGVELYARFARLPSSFDFDHAAREFGHVDQTLTIPSTRRGTYFILAKSRFGDAGTGSFDITPSVVGLSVESIAPQAVSNAGRATFELRGTAFDPTSNVTLERAGAVVTAREIEVRDASVLFATFDLTGQQIGDYDVVITNADQSDTLVDTVLVQTEPEIDPLQLNLSIPEALRFGRSAKLLVEYENVGGNDMIAPLLRLTANGAALKLPSKAQFGEDELVFLAISQDGPAGILRPGERSSLEIEFLSNGELDQDIDFELFRVDPNVPLDWNSQREMLQPNHINDDAWDHIFDNLVADFGTAADAFNGRLATNASYLSSLGIYTEDVSRLLNLQVDRANAAVEPILYSIVDTHMPAVGLDLNLVRSFQQPIHGRFEMGEFGRGWVHNWLIELTDLGHGDVSVRNGAYYRNYRLNEDGTYLSLLGDDSTLTNANGIFQLTEQDGTITSFRPNGLFEFVQVPSGSRVTATYDDQQNLLRVTHSNDEFVEFEYDPNGRITRLSDSVGNQVTYAYDGSGEHLLSYVDRFGTHRYAYHQQSGPKQHALESVCFTQANCQLFSYDDRGRLVQQSTNAGDEIFSISYPSDGSIVYSDGVGIAYKQLLNDAGTLEREVSPNGQTIDFEYDAKHALIEIAAPGIVSEFNRQENNRVIYVDPIGAENHFEYDDNGYLLAVTDAMGRVTRYDYDHQQNLIAITNPNATQEKFTYDRRGAIEHYSDATGRTITFETNDAGQVTKRTYANGDVVDFTFDARNRLAEAIDKNGSIRFEYNDEDEVTKVTYPNGRFLEFEYNDVGNRTRLTDHDGFRVDYSYDADERLERISRDNQTLVSYTYDTAGRVVRKDKGNGSQTTYQYGAESRVTQIAHFSSPGVINLQIDYEYDHHGRMISSTFSDQDPETLDGTTQFHHDSAGQIIRIDFPDGDTVTYEYDLVGNRVRSEVNGEPLIYSTNQLNQYTQVADTRFSYDMNGNLTGKSDGTTTISYAYNNDNQLIAIDSDEEHISFEYDALGQRASSTKNGTTLSYLNDPLGLWATVADYENESLRNHYVYGIGLEGQTSDSAELFYDFDTTGNTLGLTGADGTYVNHYRYDPFGERQTLSETQPNPFTFSGQFGVLTDGTNSWMRNRSYDATMGRFTSPDPIGIQGGDVNFVRYVGNAPNEFVDPQGTFLVATAGAGALIGGIAGGAIAAASGGSAGSIVGGIVSGAITGAGFGLGVGFGGAALYGGIGGAIGNLFQQRVDNPGMPATAFDYGAVGRAGAIGAIGGPLGRFLPRGSGGILASTANRFWATNITKFGVGGVAAVVGGFDPNDIIGPAGVGEGNHILPNQTLPYTVRFENLKDASAPAQEVFVTHPLDDDLDLSTFELKQIGFAEVVIDVPSGLQNYETSIDYQNIDGSPLRVDLSAKLDIESRTVLWTFLSVDPFTGSWPPGVFDGFLPPNTDPPIGEGFLSYTIRPNENLPSGTRLEPSASIVFDVNDPIETPPIFNTIDAGTPTSQVEPLPASVDSPSFTVSWSGQDEPGGSGVGTYDIFVSDNGGPFELLLQATENDSTTFLGQIGHTYSFYSVAVDLVGHREPDAQAADAQTRVVGGNLPGDFDGDGAYSPQDVDGLCDALRGNVDGVRFDLNSDGRVSFDDYEFFIHNLIDTNFGDADLNGIFDSSDLVTIFRGGQYEDRVEDNSGWLQGDWNCDGDFDTSDLVTAFRDGGYVEAAVSIDPDRPWDAAMAPIPTFEKRRSDAREPVVHEVDAAPIRRDLVFQQEIDSLFDLERDFDKRDEEPQTEI